MRSGGVGRNDPCPCGSGKKYKKCHGQIATIGLAIRPDVARANAFKKLDIALGERLLTFATQTRGRGWLPQAFDEYLGIGGGELPQPDLPLALPWVLHSRWEDDNHLATLAEDWRAKQVKKSLDPDMATLLDAYRESWLSIWEVAGVDKGVGVTLVDQLTREERFVLDVASSNSVRPLAALLGFVLDCNGVSFFGGVHGNLLPPHEAADVISEARRICRVRTRPVAKRMLRQRLAARDHRPLAIGDRRNDFASAADIDEHRRGSVLDHD